MAQTVKLKRSNTAGTIPTTSNLALGEVAINTKDGKFFLRKHVDGSTGDAIHAYAPQGINAYGTQELVVKVVTKTTAHPNHGNGSSSGYTVQGLEGPFLALIPGNTYKFDVSDSTNSGHPFRFYLDAAKASAYTTGVTTSGSAGNSGAYVQIAVTTSTPQVLYYQCSSHSLMGSAAYVASDAIAANAVGTSQIAQNSITSSEIPNNSIGATQISAAVLAAKQDTLGNNSITAAMISQNTVGISELNVTDGSNGQVLTTNGSGTLSFATQSAGTVTETFKTVSVSGQDDVVADGATDTLTLAAGSGMTITTNASSDTITFVSSASGIADDAVTTSKIADLNVTSAKLAANSVTSAKIATDAVGASEIAANSVGISELNVSDGSNGQVLTTNGSGTLSFATASGSVSEAFKTLAVSGQDNVVADSATDTLTFAAGSNMTITTNASNDTITFASSGSGGSSSSFAKNTFTGDGSDTTFTLSTSMSNEDNLIVFIDGVYQADNVYSVSGTTLTFATAPVNGRLIEVFQIEGGIVGTAPVIATMTGDGSDTTLALGTTPNSENSTFVTIDGVMQHKSTYSVSGSTLTFSTAPPNGTAVEAITLVNQTTTSLQDSDGDTKIQLEESNDEDKIRFDTGGTQVAVLAKAAAGSGATANVKGMTLYPADTNEADGLELRFQSFDASNNKFDGKITWNNNSDSYYFGLDDSRDELAMGFGTTTVGSNTALRMDDSRNILVSQNLGIGGGDGGSTGDLYVDGALPAKLQVHDSGSGVSQAKFTNGTTGKLVGDGFNIGIDADEKALVWNFENTDMKFATNNTERMVINSSGNVGIGTTSPGTILHTRTSDATANNNSGGGFYHIASSTAGTRRAQLFLDADKGDFSTSSDGAYAYLEKVGGGGAFNIRQQDTSDIGFYISSNEKMRLASNGNLTLSDSLGVGTGTTAPNSRLQIKKDGTGNYANQTFSNANSAAGITFGIAGSGTGNYLADNAFLLNTGASNFIFGTNDTEKMRIINSASYANLCIGRTGIIGDASVGLHLTTGGWAIGEGTAGNTTAGSYRRAYFASANDGLYYWNGTNQAYLTSAGVWTDASDERLKKDIVDIPYGLDAVKSLKPRKYKMKANDLEQVGFIAQEVKDIIPEVAELTTVEHSDKENQDQYGLSYGHLTAVLTKAIQELLVKLEAAEARITKLEE